MGQWKVIESKSPAPSDLEDVYRLVRYASIEHWQATRFQTSLVGNGPAFDKSLAGFSTRDAIEKGSKGIYFLQGKMAPGGPYFMPGLQEQYERVQSNQRPDVSDPTIPVRVDVAQPGDEIVEIRYQRVQKGSYPQFVAMTEESIWPWEEKLGARPLGQWQVIYPTGYGSAEQSPRTAGAPLRGLEFITSESAAYDEVVTITRYASRVHFEAMAPDKAVYLGGNGPDWKAWAASIESQRRPALLTEVSLYEARRLLEQSLAIDPNYARAAAMLSWTHLHAYAQPFDGGAESRSLSW